MISPRSILVVLTGSLGDIVRGLPIASGLKQSFPDAIISWLVEDRWLEIVNYSNSIDRILVFNRKEGLRGFVSTIRSLQSIQFDLTLDLQRNLKSGIFSFASGAHRRVGFHRSDSKEFNWLFNTDYIPRTGNEINKLLHYQAFLQYLTGNKNIVTDYGWKNHQIDSAGISYNLSSYGVLVLGSSWESKDWPIQGYHSLTEQLLHELPNEQLVLIGGPSKKVESEQIESSISNSRLINLVGKTSLMELVAIIKNSDFAVGPDSGPGHLASSFNVPFISLFGPTSIQRTAPYAMDHLAISSKIGCSPCYRRKCPGLDRLCMRLLGYQTVLSKILGLPSLQTKLLSSKSA